MKTKCDCYIVYFLIAIGILSILFDLKVPAAAMMVVGENYQVDAGIEGSNGKGVFWCILVNALGSYVCTVDEALLTKEPPPQGSPNHAMVKIRGRRILGTPESSGLAIKVNWIKMFR